jgi:hypothetical protein
MTLTLLMVGIADGEALPSWLAATGSSKWV